MDPIKGFPFRKSLIARSAINYFLLGNHWRDTFLLSINRLELFHCERRLSGFFFYIFFIIVYLCMYNIFSAQTYYLYVYILYFVTVAIYASFRNCFNNRENNIMILKFPKFHKIYIQLQQENTISNRNLFFQLYFLFFLVIIGAKKSFFFLYYIFKALLIIQNKWKQNMKILYFIL